LLEHLGWDPAIEEQFAPYAAEGLVPARVAVEQRGALLVYLQSGERWAELSGRLRHTTGERGDLPAVGDWVAIADPEGPSGPSSRRFSRVAPSSRAWPPATTAERWSRSSRRTSTSSS
jgi:ribosome biogenesis GTPase